MAKENLIATAESLGINPLGLTVVQLEKAIAEKEAADVVKATLDKALEFGIETKEVDFEVVAEAVSKKEAELKAIADAKAKELEGKFELDGKIYGLSERTPKTLRVLDTTYTQEELLQNAEAMQFLIVGRSCFVKRLK
jgi:hypothetical protein